MTTLYSQLSLAARPNATSKKEFVWKLVLIGHATIPRSFGMARGGSPEFSTPEQIYRDTIIFINLQKHLLGEIDSGKTQFLR